MSEADQDKRLGQLLVATGKLSQDQVTAALKLQQDEGGAQHKRLGSILMELGLATMDDIRQALAQQHKQLMWCPRCQVRVNIQGASPGTRYACKQCRGELQPASKDQDAEAEQTWTAIPLPSAASTESSDHVQTVLSDPTPHTSPSVTSATPGPSQQRDEGADSKHMVGRFEVVSELGRGGMGVVYRANDPQLNRPVAIKMILDTAEVSPQVLARFHREAQAAAKVRHPGIVSVHEAGEVNGQPYLVMDFVEGETFEDLLRRESVSPRRIAKIVRDAARALHHAHEAGITHRDVKPQNIMLDAQEDPHIMDFGLARDSSARQQLTQAGQIMGTPAYMAPEQADDTGKKAHGPFTDVYALGAVLYRALTDKAVFESTSQISLLKQVLLDEPSPLRQHDPKISPDLETITLRCLEKEPERRFESAGAVADELQRFLDGEPILARPISQAEKAMRWVRRNRALASALLVVVALLLAALVGGMSMQRTARLQAEQSRQALEKEKLQLTTRLEQEARDREQQAAELERERAKSDALDRLREEVSATLEIARTSAASMSNRELSKLRTKLLKHQDPVAVSLLVAELDELTDYLALNQSLSKAQVSFLHFLCETLWNLGIAEVAVEGLGRYLEVEIALPAEAENQGRAVPAGRALCLLGGQEADRLLREARVGFGLKGPFWRQVRSLYKRSSADPALSEDSAQGYLDRGLAREAKGDHKRAIEDYTEAIDRSPDDPSAYLYRGDARRRQGDLDGAIVDYTHSIERDSSLVDAWYNRGRCRLDQARLRDAVHDFSRALEIAPKLQVALVSRADANRMRNRQRLAVRDYTAAIKLNAKNVEAWFGRGRAFLKGGKLEEAIADMSQATKLAPRNWLILATLGLARGQTGAYEAAYADYVKAMELNPTAALPWINKGITNRLQKNYEDSIAALDRATQLEPMNTIAWNQLGISKRTNGDLVAAIAAHSEALEIDPRKASSWGLRALARESRGKISGAIADYSRCIELDQGIPAAYRHRAQMLLQKGRVDEGIADLEEFLKRMPRSAEAANVRASIDEAKKQLKAAGGG